MNNIFAPNYTQLPNVVIDYWMHVLSPAEFKVLCIMCRKTFGWHVFENKMSNKELIEITNLSKQGLLNAVNRLIELELIVKEHCIRLDGGNDSTLYYINVQKFDGGSKAELTPPSQLSRPPLVNSVDPPSHTRVTDIKEREYKEKRNVASASALRLSSFFLQKIKEMKPDFKEPSKEELEHWAKDIDKMLRLDKRSEANIEAVLQWLPTNEFWRQNILSGRKLREQFDKLELVKQSDRGHLKPQGEVFEKNRAIAMSLDRNTTASDLKGKSVQASKDCIILAMGGTSFYLNYADPNFFKLLLRFLEMTEKDLIRLIEKI